MNVKKAKAVPRARTQEQRSDATRGELIEAARRLFGTRGYAQTSIEDVVVAAAVTRGALYHHFEDKTGLFRAVFEREEQQQMAAIGRAAARAQDPWAQVRAGCRAFLDECLDPSVRRIMLLDGPAVLGWKTVREIESRYTLALLQQGLGAAAKAGQLRSGDISALAHLLFGALCEGGMLIARAADAKQAAKQIAAEIERLFEGARR